MGVDVMIPGLSLRSYPGLKLANAFGVIQTDALAKTPKLKPALQRNRRRSIQSLRNVVAFTPEE